MKTPLAWRNVSHNRVRSVIALVGISFAILLIFMQLGFYGAASRSATSVYDALDFDLVVLSRQYVFLASPARFSRSLLEAVRGTPGISSVEPLWLGLGEWRSRETRERWNILTLGVDPARRPFRPPDINDRLPLLQTRDTALTDTRSRPEHGPLAPGVVSEVQHRRIRVVGQYGVGAGFVAGATMVTSRETFLRIFDEASPEQVNAGLVTLTTGTSPERVARALSERLWPEAMAVTRADLFQGEERYWLSVKPIGIMFTSGLLIAFVAGAVVLYQVLTSEVQNRLREYATLKALGYSDPQVYGVVLRQALLFAGLGFIPAFLLSLVLYFLLRTQAQVPVTMDLGRAAGVGALVAFMCLTATMLAVRKLRYADPADLF
jgi:putative ABC transport system permease protein